MKTTKLILTGLFVFGAFAMQAQNVASTTDVTSGGEQAGNYGTGNAFYGYKAGIGSNNSIFNYNTIIGNLAGVSGAGSNNVFVGYNSGYKYSPRFFPGSGSVFIGYNVGLSGENTSNKLAIDNSTTNTPLIWGDFTEDLLKFNGQVGIGFDFGSFPTTAGTVNVSGYNLFVNGGILTEEVRVMLKTQWADYVFEEEYNLPKLEEVEQFIKENKHLPNVPSAKEVAENGLEFGEIAKIQQEKIEELTLYLIEQNKIIKQQQQELYEMKARIEVLENQK